jgi:hypothetical protein
MTRSADGKDGEYFIQTPSVNDMVRAVLEDFDVIATRQHAVLVRGRPFLKHFATNIRAAVVASTLGLASVDYARRRYCEDEKEAEAAAVHAYIDAYYLAKTYIQRLTTSLVTQGKPEPSVGVYGASIVLERLLLSFFCAHLMYQMGYRYEGHAISRLILEQIAWAFQAREAVDMDAVERIKATTAVTELVRFAPDAGRLYGFLSKKTHIDYSSHMEFLRLQDGQGALVYAHDVMPEYGSVILRLADLFGLVWEASQFPYLAAAQAVERREGVIVPKPDRPYLAAMQAHLDNIQRAADHAKKAPEQTNSTLEPDAPTPARGSP